MSVDAVRTDAGCRRVATGGAGRVDEEVADVMGGPFFFFDMRLVTDGLLYGLRRTG